MRVEEARDFPRAQWRAVWRKSQNSCVSQSVSGRTSITLRGFPLSRRAGNSRIRYLRSSGKRIAVNLRRKRIDFGVTSREKGQTVMQETVLRAFSHLRGLKKGSEECALNP